MITHLKDSNEVLRLDILIALLSIFSLTPLAIFMKNPKFRIIAGVLPVGALLYLGSQRLDSNDVAHVSQGTEDKLHLLILFLIVFVITVSPRSQYYQEVLYYPGIGILAGIISVGVLFAQHRTRLYVFEILLLSVLVRGTIFSQYPSIPGVDAVHTHAPTVLLTLSEGTITSPSYYGSFPISHLRAVTGALLSSANLKRSMYFFVYLPQAASVLFVYVFVRTFWGKEPALIACIFIATTSFNILYGFRRFPQATSVALLPILLFTLSNDAYRDRILSVLLFGAILLAHNAPSWLILIFLSLLLPLEYIVRRGKHKQMILSGALLFVTLFGVMKLEYIWVSDYYNNIGRIVNTILSALGIRSLETLPTRSTGPGEYRFALLRFSSSHIMLSTVFYFLFLRYLKKGLQWRKGISIDQREIKIIIWYLPVAMLWALAGYVLISNAPKNTKMFSVLGVLAAPLLYWFLERFRRFDSLGPAVLVVFLLVFSISLVGVTHPRSNVSEFNRPGEIALTQEELNTIAFTDFLEPDSSANVPDEMFGYWWLFSEEISRVEYSTEQDVNYRIDNGEPAEINESDNKIYTSGATGRIYSQTS